jgi:hypothetical protein
MSIGLADASSAIIAGCFISYIRPGSPAGNCRELAIADLIAKVNGVSF